MLDGQKIIAFSGRKESGKNTAVNFVHSLALTFHKVTPQAMVDPDTGQLVVAISDDQLGVYDLNNRDKEYLEFANTHVFPFIRKFSFAGKLKEFCVDVLGLTPEQVYGTNEQKNSLTRYKWEDMPIPPSNLKKTKDGKYIKTVDKTGFMTAREVQQYFGTEIGRAMYSDVWVEAGVRQAVQSETGLALFDDVRFPNEVEGVQKAGGKVIRLTRTIHPNDTHPSETALDRENYDWSKFDYVIDNQNLTIYQTCDEIFKVLKELGIVEE